MTLHEQTIGDFLTALGAKTPTPGGGAVAGLTGAMAASLGQMVVRFTVGKKRFAEHADAHQAAIVTLDSLARRALQSAADDEAAYGSLNALMKLPVDDPQRVVSWNPAVEAAIAAPMAAVDCGDELLRLLASLASNTNEHLASDLAIAADLALAAAKAGALNIEVNLTSLSDVSRAESIRARLRTRLASLTTVRESIPAVT